MKNSKNHFHLHLISDSTGETLLSAARAVSVQYENASAIEHISSMIVSKKQIENVLVDIDREPGIVLYTMADEALAHHIETRCGEMGVPAINLLKPVIDVFQSYLGQQSSGKSGAQHILNTRYFERMEALNFAMAHDDGHLPENLEDADIVLLGISRTSKTPTAIYLAQRGIRVTNIPLNPEQPLSLKVNSKNCPLIVALIASPDRIVHLRRNRILSYEGELLENNYIDRASITEEITYTRKLCKDNNWPMIDVSKRSIEETAAEIMTLYSDRQLFRTIE